MQASSNPFVLLHFFFFAMHCCEQECKRLRDLFVKKTGKGNNLKKSLTSKQQVNNDLYVIKF